MTPTRAATWRICSATWATQSRPRRAATPPWRRRDSKPYDLGLLDLRMPGMDGLTLCRHLKQLQPPMVTMIVTAYGGSDLDEEARAAGARHVLPKPVDFPRLLALVEKALIGA